VESLSIELLTEVASLSSQGLLVVDASGSGISIVYANPAFQAMAGFTPSELDGSDWLAYAAVDDESAEVARLRQQLAQSEPFELNIPFLRPGGDVWYAALKCSPLKAGTVGRRLWLIEHPVVDVAHGASAEMLKRALGQARRKLASLDRVDQVTGLLSRSHFEMLLRHELAVSRREDRQLTLMLFAVPELDIYRRTFGDNAADSCLRMIGAQIAGTFRRASDLCARLDESLLAVVALGQSDQQAANLVATVKNKTRNLALHNPRGTLGRHIVLQGVWVQADPEGDDSDRLIGRARETLAATTGGSQESATNPA
jgi:diguanylate cyclase (GGDEF)-like protein/PAS domain S-box-containing protein